MQFLRLQFSDGFVHQGTHIGVVFPDVYLRHLKKGLLCLVEQVKHIRCVFIGLLMHMGSNGNQFPLNGFFGDDPRVVFYVSGGVYFGGEFGDVVCAAHKFKLAVFSQLVGDREHINGLRLVEKLYDGSIDLFVRIAIKAFGFENFYDHV